MFSTNYSYPFTPYDFKGKRIIRPELTVILQYKDNIFPTNALIDSGADYSIFRYDTAKDGLKIPIDDLEEDDIPVKGIAGKTLKTVSADITMTFYFKYKEITYELPIKIIKDKSKQPVINLIGRIPFFYDYRVDFRMGYTKDESLGKFILYPEQKKRDPTKFKKPASIVVK